MSECVWWVKGTLNSPHPAFTFGITEASNLGTVDHLDETLHKDFGKIKSGQIIDVDRLPVSMTVDAKKVAKTKLKQKNGHRLPNFFYTFGYWIVTNDAFEIFQAHDMGAAVLHPITLYEYGETERIDEPIGILMPGNLKEAFDFDASPRVLEKIGMPELKKRPRASYDMEDDFVGVTAHATNGPDIWVDPLFRLTFFLSDALVSALRAADAAHGFDLIRARVV